jgi:hypothetical protein
MEYTYDLPAAAERHYQDCCKLLENSRLDNAGYHFGLAAECAVKQGLANAGVTASDGFRFLFAHLARFARCDEDDWLVRFRLIHAKAPEDAKLQEAFRDQAFDIFREFLYHPVVLTDETGAALLTEEGERLTVEEYSPDAQEAPHYAWPILRDANYYYADPLANPDLLEPSYYLNSHRHLLDGILTLRGAAEGTVP